MDEKQEHPEVGSSNGAIQQQSDDEDNDQEEEDLDEEDDDIEEYDDEEENSASNKSIIRPGVQQLHSRVRQNSASDPSSPPPAKKGRSELARFYEAAVKGRTLRSTVPGSIGQGSTISYKNGKVGIICPIILIRVNEKRINVLSQTYR